MKFFKPVAIISGAIISTALYLAYFILMDVFYYNDLSLFYIWQGIFFLPALVSGYFVKNTKQSVRNFAIPLSAAVLIAVVYTGITSGIHRLGGWIQDQGLHHLLFIGTAILLHILMKRIQPSVKRFKRIVLTGIILCPLLLTTVQTISFFNYSWGAMIPVPIDASRMSYKEAFNTVIRELDHYPYYKYLNIDWRKLKADTTAEMNDFLKSLQKSPQNKKLNDLRFCSIIQKMYNLGGIAEGHAIAWLPSWYYKDQSPLGAAFHKVENRFMIRKVYCYSIAEKSGLKKNMTLIAINSVPIETAMRKIPDFRIEAKPGTVWWKRMDHIFRLFYLFWNRVGTKMKLTLIDTKGTKIHKTITYSRRFYRAYDPNPITGKILKNRYGYIRIKREPWDWFRAIADFNTSLRKVWNSRGLIIDLRGNQGGVAFYVSHILGRFTDRKIFWGVQKTVQGKSFPFELLPCSPRYKKPVVILIDKFCVSAGDYLAYAAKQVPEITLVGRATGGYANQREYIYLPGGGGAITLYSGLADTNGNYVIQTSGVQPHIRVPLTINDIRRGIDRDIMTATNVIERKHKSNQ